MEYILGVVLALGISGLATVVGLDRDRAFYPTLTIVIVSYYGLFAVIGGSLHALMLESAGVAAFLLVFCLWFVVMVFAEVCLHVVLLSEFKFCLVTLIYFIR